jgi:hypothetical protein
LGGCPSSSPPDRGGSSDPEFAKAAGFPAPILHGLCTYGIVLREVIDLLLDGDATAVGGFGARFAGVVPGRDTLDQCRGRGGRYRGDRDVGDDARPALADCSVTRA